MLTTLARWLLYLDPDPEPIAVYRAALTWMPPPGVRLRLGLLDDGALAVAMSCGGMTIHCAVIPGTTPAEAVEVLEDLAAAIKADHWPAIDIGPVEIRLPGCRRIDCGGEETEMAPKGDDA